MAKTIRSQDLTSGKTVELLAQAKIHVTYDQATAIERVVREVDGIDQDTKNGRNRLRRDLAAQRRQDVAGGASPGEHASSARNPRRGGRSVPDNSCRPSGQRRSGFR